MGSALGASWGEFQNSRQNVGAIIKNLQCHPGFPMSYQPYSDVFSVSTRPTHIKVLYTGVGSTFQKIFLNYLQSLVWDPIKFL